MIGHREANYLNRIKTSCSYFLFSKKRREFASVWSSSSRAKVAPVSAPVATVIEGILLAPNHIPKDAIERA